MSRVLLVNPPWYALLGMSSSAMPIGLTSLAAVLRDAGHTVAVYNADLHGNLYASDLDVLRGREDYLRRLDDDEDPAWQTVRDRLKRWQPEVVGVHVKTPSWASGRMVARMAKSITPGVMTVCGGPHVSCMPKDVAETDDFDFGIAGEGEIPFLELLASNPSGTRDAIPGVITGGTPMRVPHLEHAVVEDLDTLPFDGRGLLMDRHDYETSGLGAIMTGRGCPFQCTYCASKKIWKRRVRLRSPDNVLAEVCHAIADYGVKLFKFIDDTFTLDRNRARRICDMLSGMREKIQWTCVTRADCLDRDLVSRMRRSGCISVSIGVESGSPRILKSISKGETREDIARGCLLLREGGIPFVAFIMIGFPTETIADAWETMEFARGLGADSLCGSVVTPYPGTPLYGWARENGKVPDHGDWREYYHQNEGMGLWDVPEHAARETIEKWFGKIEAYNHRSMRLIRRFVTEVRSDPWGTVRRTACLVPDQATF